MVALRAVDGSVAWHFQIVHHDVWDLDLPAQPMLVDLVRNGETVPVVIQLTKQGLIFVLHRDTGVPVFPVEERSVPTDGVPGEHGFPRSSRYWRNGWCGAIVPAWTAAAATTHRSTSLASPS